MAAGNWALADWAGLGQPGRPGPAARLFLRRGDFAGSKAQALAAGYAGPAGWGMGACKALGALAGPGLERYAAAARAQPEPGCAVALPGFGLGAGRIALLAHPPYGGSGDAAQEALAMEEFWRALAGKAASCGARSMACPILGCGGFGWTAQASARAFFRAFKNGQGQGLEWIELWALGEQAALAAEQAASLEGYCKRRPASSGP